MDQVAGNGIARPIRLVRNAADGDVAVFREYRCDVHRYQGIVLHQSCWQRAVPDEDTTKYRFAPRLTTPSEDFDSVNETVEIYSNNMSTLPQ